MSFIRADAEAGGVLQDCREARDLADVLGDADVFVSDSACTDAAAATTSSV
jgi:hypothetical protein